MDVRYGIFICVSMHVANPRLLRLFASCCGPTRAFAAGRCCAGAERQGVRLYRETGQRTACLLALGKARALQKAGVGRHRFELSEIMKAYDTFGNAAKERALKVVLKTTSASGGALKGNL